MLGLFGKWTSQHEELTSKLFKVMRSAILENGPKWSSLKPQITVLLRNVISSYSSTNLPTETKIRILECLCNTILGDNLLNYYGNEVFIDWIQNLPNMLLENQISYHTLQTFINLAKYNNLIFKESFRSKSTNILNNLSTIEITGIDDQFEGKKLIMNLFYGIESEETRALVRKMESNTYQIYLKQLFDGYI